MDAKGMSPIAITSGLHIPEHNYFSISYDTLADTITYKLGGSTGVTVAVLLVTFTDATKTVISSTERTV